MKTIFSYSDYRIFLKDYYEHQKEMFPGFSHRSFLQKAGIKNSGFLSQVIDGKRNLTPASLEKIVAVLRLEQNEKLYFHHLVTYNQAKTAKQKQEAFLLLKQISGMTPQKIVEDKVHLYFGKWYIPVIREIICQKAFYGDYTSLANSLIPSISDSEAKKAVSFLLTSGYVKRTGENSYTYGDRAIKCSDKASRETVKRFNNEMIELGAEALMNLPLQERYIRGLTCGISEECYKMVSVELDNFFERIVTLVDADAKSDQVYQLNVQLFPLTKKGE